MLEVSDGNEGEHVVARGSAAIWEKLKAANQHSRTNVCKLLLSTV